MKELLTAEPQPRSTYSLHRRFDRMGRLVGDEAMEKLANAHVMVIGVGGVGSFAAESLARSGVGKITLVDFDDICVTNANRQLHCLQGLIGKKKAAIMAERLQKINPEAEIVSLEKFYNLQNSEEILSHKPDIILDCIDNMTAKCYLIATCVQRNILLIVAGGAAAKLDPLAVEVAPIYETHTDPFLQHVRKVLRTKYDLPEELDIPTVFSTEPPILPKELKYDKGEGFKCVCPKGQNDLHSCDNRNVIWGTASFVTGNFGLVMASITVRKLIEA